MRSIFFGMALFFSLCFTGCSQTDGQNQDVFQFSPTSVSRWLLKNVRNDVDRSTTPVTTGASILIEIRHLKFTAIDLGRDLMSEEGLVVDAPETGPNIHFAGGRDFEIEFPGGLYGIPTLMNRFTISKSNESALELAAFEWFVDDRIGGFKKDPTRVFEFEAVSEQSYGGIRDTYFTPASRNCGPDTVKFLRAFEGCD